MTKIVLISPNQTEIKSYSEETIKDSLEGFFSSVWEQGWGANERVLETYGDWSVYQAKGDKSLTFLGTYSELLQRECHALTG